MITNLRPVSDDEFADAIGDALAKEVPTTRTLIARSKQSLSGSIETLRNQQAALQKLIADKRAELHQVTETIAALESARGKLAESAA
ncbi:hypothetical protein [Pseudaminobacter salicylatoxidans]|uniref:hypothetical protein n=1 Tax=Pseudaminobacter salicylatoxidans TaxID=93369 RepID=UPI0002D7B107|nr:hypothetical protein [Pseudaminobacter salicylatoxidans]